MIHNYTSSLCIRHWPKLPAFLLCWLLFSTGLQAQTLLAPGDLVFVGYNGSDDQGFTGSNGQAITPGSNVNDKFAFVLLKGVSANTKIYFTDYGWLTGGGFQAAWQAGSANGGSGTGSKDDGILSWTASASVAAGTQVVIRCKYSIGASIGTVASVENVSGQSYPLNLADSDNDQLFAYQAASARATPTLLAGLMYGDVWSSLLSNSEYTPSKSTLPTALTTGVTAALNLPTTDPVFNTFALGIYDCSKTTVGFPKTLRNTINSQPNWKDYKNPTPFLPDYPNGIEGFLYNTDPDFLTHVPAGWDVPVPCTFTILTLQITAQPVSKTVCSYQTATFSITAQNAQTYKWQSSPNGTTGWTDLANGPVYTGVNTTTLTITNTTGLNGTFYRGVAMEPVEPTTVNSNPALLTVNDPAQALTLTSSGTITCSVASVRLTASSTTAGLVYTFRGPSGAINTAPGVTTVTAGVGGLYSVTATTPQSCSASTSVTVIEDKTPPASVGLSVSGPITCTVTSVTLTATASSTSTIGYLFTGPQGVVAGTGNKAVITSAGTYTVTTTATTNGCSATATTSVTANTTAPTATLTNNGPISCSVPSVTLTAGTDIGTRFLFSNGAAQVGGNGGNTATVTNGGTYSVIVTGANGCSAVASTTVTGSSTPISVTLSASTPISCTAPVVTLTATPISGATYVFSAGTSRPGSTTSNTATVTTAGIYTVTVTNASNCTATAMATVTGSSVPFPVSLTASNPISCTATSVTLTATPIGGASYAFSNGVVQQGGSAGNTAIVSTAGVYSVVVTNSNSCTASAQTTVTGSTTAPVAGLIKSGQLSCINTSVTLTASGGGTYAFSGPGLVSSNTSSGTAVANAAGTYSVTVTGANGCSSTATTTVVSDTVTPTATLVSSGSLSCAVTSVTLTTNAGSGLSYSFSAGASQIGSGNTALVNVSGIYSVTVTGANGCSSTATTSVSGNSTAPTVGLLSSGTLTCAQTSVTLTASGGGTYAFSGPGVVSQSGNRAVVNVSGSYSVTVTGANGCTNTITTIVSSNTVSPTATLTTLGSSTLTCAQTSVTLTAGGGASYVFSGPGIVSQSGNTAIVNKSGTYSVTATGSNGCTSTTTTSVSSNTAAPAATLTTLGSSTLTCAQTSVTLVASGGVSYAFAGPGIASQSGNTAVVNASGLYSVTVTGANGCQAVSTTTVSADTSTPMAALVVSGTISCAQTSVTLTASGGVSYVFAGPGVVSQSGNKAVVNVSGTYSVTATNASGCKAISSTSVSGDTTPPTASLVSSNSLNCSVTSVTLTASGGGSYAFSGPGLVSSNSSSGTAVANAGGAYSVTVTGPNGCSSTATTSVLSNTMGSGATLVSSGSLSCAITSVTLTANAGSGLSYAFSPGASQIGSSNQAVVTTSGTYSVTVSSSNGCSSTATTSVTSNTMAPTASLVSSGSLSCAQTTVTLTASDGSTYAFSGPGVVSQSGNQVIVNASGTYSVTVTGSNGCSSTASVVVSQDNTAPTATITGTLTVVAGGTTTLTASGGGSYRWSTGQITASISVTAGTYSVTVTSANGCFATASATVTTVAPANTAPTVVNGVSPQSATVGVGYTLSVANTFTDTETPNNLTLTVTGLPAGLSLNGTTISGTPSTSVGSPFSVTLTATDPGNLSGYTVFTITVSPAASVTSSAPFAITGVTTIDCTPIDNRINVTFNPLYAGLNGSPVNFSVVNELSATTNPGPYSLVLYPDNPVITLYAVQSGVVSTISYNWLGACGTTPPTPGNTPPRVANAVGPQSATVGMGFTLSLANTFTDTETPDNLVLSASGLPAGLTLNGTTISGTPSSANGSPFNVTITATDPGGLSVSLMFSMVVSPAMSVTSSSPFAITSVTTLDCSPVGNQLNLSFSPQYAGLNGQVITFSVVNELAPTTSPAPYTLRVYADNKVLTLQAVQSGVTSTFSYNWYAACTSGGNPTPGNTAPTVANGVSPQSATVGVGYTLSVVGSFTDAETPGSLVLTAAGLPAGLSLNGTTISGTPSTTVGSPNSVTLTARDPGNLSAYTVFTLTVSPAGSAQPPVGGFAIAGVTTVSCVSLTAGQRSVSFTPQYVGLDGSTVTFSVVNELPATTSPGPYTLRLYTDNPTITLKAVQSGVSSSFAYNWLATCGTQSAGSRQAANEPAVELSVKVLGNPTLSEAVSIEIRGAEGQSLVLKTIDSRGRVVSEQSVPDARAVEEQIIQVGSSAGVYMLQIATLGRIVTTKILKR